MAAPADCGYLRAMPGSFSTMLRRMVRKDRVRLIHASGAEEFFGPEAAPPLAIRFADAGAERWCGLDPELKIGEMFMEGRLLVENGNAFDLVSMLKRNGLRRGALLHHRAIGAARAMGLRAATLFGGGHAKRNVAHHYDLDERLFSLFLDGDWHYSCAYFEPPAISLEDAQRTKARRIAAKLLLQPGQRVLDIGSGWGSLAMYLAESSGVVVTGVTLSEEQLAAAERRARERNLGARVGFALQDYRAVAGTFDRIVSVGMFEHVGFRNYGVFFRKAASLLDKKGVMVLHAIGGTRPTGRVNPWMARYIFPGGYIPALSEVLPAAEQAGLLIKDVEIWPLHYAHTLRAWRERFMARRAEAAALYDERFCRMWEFYFAGSEAAFRHDRQFVFQIQLARHQDAVPMSRNYIAEAEADLRSRGF
jgi:cyclopropane-fatty-acyl-phospholipid synthase